MSEPGFQNVRAAADVLRDKHAAVVARISNALTNAKSSPDQDAVDFMSAFAVVLAGEGPANEGLLFLLENIITGQRMKREAAQQPKAA